ncbi:MAG TPA: hypothetical protein P5159_11240 [Phycisphaerae bacterium]|nr:hypothetical protein [Phycisphaerae bacterium]
MTQAAEGSSYRVLIAVLLRLDAQPEEEFIKLFGSLHSSLTPSK